MKRVRTVHACTVGSEICIRDLRSNWQRARDIYVPNAPSEYCAFSASRYYYPYTITNEDDMIARENCHDIF